MVQAPESSPILQEASGAERENRFKRIRRKLLQRVDLPMDGPNHEGMRYGGSLLTWH